jgi:acyl CoA:acetate/3-ketoacid CoA transferase alpha subunit
MPIDKVVGSFDEAVKDVFDGALILIGGFGNPGSCPSYLIRALAKQGAKQLTIVANTTGITSKEMMERQHQMLLMLTFGGGTNEVMRDIVAMMGFGMMKSR